MNILKIIGLIFVFITICLTSFKLAENLLTREKTLSEIINAINRYKTLANYSGKETKSILYESFSGVKGLFFEGLEPIISNEFQLKKEEKADLENFIESCGRRTIKGENTNCDYYISVFQKYKNQASKALAQKRKIYLVSGVSLAFATVVILI